MDITVNKGNAAVDPQTLEKNHSRHSSFWILLCLFAASIEPIVIKLGYRGTVTPLQLLAYKCLFGALAVMLITRQFSWIGAVKFRMVGEVALLHFLTNCATLYALKYLSAVTVITAVTARPAMVALVNQKKGRDILDPKFWLGFFLCFLGVVLTIDAFNSGTQSWSWIGVFNLCLILLSSTTYRTRMETVTEKIPPKTVSTYIFLINALLALVFLIPWVGRIDQETYILTAWMGLAAGFANVAFLAAIFLVGSTRMSIFDMLQRPLVIIFAALILQEPITSLQVIGIVMVFVGVKMAKVKKNIKNK